jgi:hypothetical protein
MPMRLNHPPRRTSRQAKGVQALRKGAPIERKLDSETPYYDWIHAGEVLGERLAAYKGQAARHVGSLSGAQSAAPLGRLYP